MPISIANTYAILGEIVFEVHIILAWYLKKVFVHSLLSLNVSKQNPQKNIKKNKNDTVDQRPL